jgi:IS605 OrfB family transposase
MHAINHRISRGIVETARISQQHIALEDLTGIRQRTRVRKVQRYRHNSWAFSQLRQFIAYKAEDAGAAVVLVAPAYTSKTCHVCGTRGHRNVLKFSCTRCGYVGDADYNAACNIAAAGAQVTGPVLATDGVSEKAAGL